MTLPWIVAGLLYFIGSISALGVTAFVISSFGGRSPTPREMGWIILWVLFWPFIAPFFVIKVLVNLLRNK